MTYPANLDNLVGPSPQGPPRRAEDMTLAFNAINAIETKLGVDSSTDTNSIDYKVGNVNTGTSLVGPNTSANVTWNGPPGGFANITSFATNEQGNPLGTAPVRTMVHGAGKSIFFHCQTSDGWIHWGGQPFTSNVFQPTGTTLECYSFDPVNRIMYQHIIPTTLGYTSVVSTAPSLQGLVGGADIEDAQVYFDNSAVEHVIFSVGRPENDWVLATYGIFPCFVVLTKSGGLWNYDATASKTSAQIQASNPGVAGSVYRNATTPITGESFVDNRHALQMAVLSSGNIAVTHYDTATTLGQNSGGISVLDKSLNLLATFICPNVTHPDDGQALQLHPKGIRFGSLSGPANRFIIDYDVFPAAPPPGTNMFGLQSLQTESDFETSLGGWTPILASATLARVASTIDGSWMMQSTATGVSTQQMETSHFRVDQGLSYIATCKTKAETVARNTVVGFRWYDAGGGFLSQSFGPQTLNSTTGVTTISSGAIQAPNLAVTGTVSCGAFSTAIGEKHDWDTFTMALTGTPTSRRFLFQEFQYNAGVISAVSKPCWNGQAGSYISQLGVDERGNLWVYAFFNGIFNSSVTVYELIAGERSYNTNYPSVSFPNAGSTTEWAQNATPNYTVAGSAIGGLPGDSPAWDNTNKRMWAVTDSTGAYYITRSGAAGSLTFSVSSVIGYRDFSITLPAGHNSTPCRLLWDANQQVCWIAARHDYAGHPYPVTPEVLSQWLVQIFPSDILPATGPVGNVIGKVPIYNTSSYPPVLLGYQPIYDAIT